MQMSKTLLHDRHMTDRNMTNHADDSQTIAKVVCLFTNPSCGGCNEGKYNACTECEALLHGLLVLHPMHEQHQIHARHPRHVLHQLHAMHECIPMLPAPIYISSSSETISVL